MIYVLAVIALLVTALAFQRGVGRQGLAESARLFVQMGPVLLPAFVLAEATMSYIGLGFPEATPTWGTMLQDASNAALLGDTPWTLAPAGAIFLVVLAVNLAVQTPRRAQLQLER